MSEHPINQVEELLGIDVIHFRISRLEKGWARCGIPRLHRRNLTVTVTEVTCIPCLTEDLRRTDEAIQKGIRNGFTYQGDRNILLVRRASLLQMLGRS